MSAPLVSVIIPAYNAEQWVGQAIDSALVQSWKEIEIIVVDDGSTDGTAELVGAIGEPQLTLIQQQNLGAAAARNHGLAMAKGDYIQFLDADDLLSDNKIKKQLEALAEAPADAIASCPWGRFSDGLSEVQIAPEAVWQVSDPIEWLLVSFCGGGMMQPGAWLCPRQVIDRAGPWDESLTLHDDGEYFTRVLLSCSRNVFVPDPLVYYREVAGSLSRSRGRKAMESALAVCESREKHLIEAIDNAEMRIAIATQYAQFAYEFSHAAPDLVRKAIGRIRGLNVSPVNCVGGQGFRVLVSKLGFRRALKVRNLMLRVRA